MKKPRILFLFICIIPLIIIGMRLKEYQKENATYQKVRKNMAIISKEDQDTIQDTIPEGVHDTDFIDFSKLIAINDDTVGYIRIDGTPIDYPVVLSKEKNSKYLKTDFEGNSSIYGTIFEDTAGGVETANTILHGHNMKNGSMFGSLKEYENEGYRNEHKKIKYIRKGTVYLYDVVCYFTASGKDNALLKCLAPYGKDGFEKLIDKIKDYKGIFYEDMSWGEQYITLATCEYTHRSGQCYVVGRLTDKIKY